MMCYEMNNQDFLVRFDEDDSPEGIHRNTLRELSKELGIPENTVVMHALAQFAFENLGQYDPPPREEELETWQEKIKSPEQPEPVMQETSPTKQQSDTPTPKWVGIDALDESIKKRFTPSEIAAFNLGAIGDVFSSILRRMSPKMLALIKSQLERDDGRLVVKLADGREADVHLRNEIQVMPGSYWPKWCYWPRAHSGMDAGENSQNEQ